MFQAEDGSPASGLPSTAQRSSLRSPGVTQPPPTRRASEGTAVDFYPALRRPMRGRSDSETLSDDAVMESQDEGFATDTRQSLSTLQQVRIGGLGSSSGCFPSFHLNGVLFYLRCRTAAWRRLPWLHPGGCGTAPA